MEKRYNVISAKRVHNGYNYEFIIKDLLTTRDYALIFDYPEYGNNINAFNHIIKGLGNSPDEYQLCYSLVEAIGAFLIYVPIKYRDYKMCNNALDTDGMALNYVPEEIMNYSLKTKAIRKNGGALAYILEGERDEKLCDLAIESKASAIRFVPEKYINYEMCSKIVFKDYHNIKYVPDKYLVKIYNELFMDGVCVLPDDDINEINFKRELAIRLNDLLNGEHYIESTEDYYEELNNLCRAEENLMEELIRIQTKRKRILSKISEQNLSR